MTLEQYLKIFLEERLGEVIVAVASSRRTALGIAAISDVNKYQRLNEFDIECDFPGKNDASDKQAQIDAVLEEFKKVPGISQLVVSNIFAQRSGEPPLWKYLTTVRITSRKGWEW